MADPKVKRGPAPPDGESSLLERRPPFEPPHDRRESGVARLRYAKSRAVWQPFCRHRDLRRHVYAPLPEAGDLSRLGAEVRADPTGIVGG